MRTPARRSGATASCRRRRRSASAPASSASARSCRRAGVQRLLRRGLAAPRPADHLRPQGQRPGRPCSPWPPSPARRSRTSRPTPTTAGPRARRGRPRRRAATYDYYYTRFGRRGVDGADARPARSSIPRRAAMRGPCRLSLRPFLLNAFCAPNAVPTRTASWSSVRAPARHGGRPVRRLLLGRPRRGRARVPHAVTDAVEPQLPERIRGAERVVLGHHGHRRRVLRLGTGRATGRLPAGRGRLHGGGAGRGDGHRSCRTPTVRPARSLLVRYTGPEDSGGVHINSGIPSHAFYLAIEGGTNRTRATPSRASAAATASRSSACSIERSPAT